MPRSIALDTNIFIYYYQRHPQFEIVTKQIFELIISGKRNGITSIITLTELLSVKAPEEDRNKLKMFYLGMPHLDTYDVTQNIALEAANIRRAYSYRLPDAIQLATAISAKADMFVTNDQRLSNFKELKVKMLTSVR